MFYRKVRLPDFLQQQLQPKEGQIIEIPDSFEDYKTTQPTFESKEEELVFRARKIKYAQYRWCCCGNPSRGSLFHQRTAKRIGRWWDRRTAFCN